MCFKCLAVPVAVLSYRSRAIQAPPPLKRDPSPLLCTTMERRSALHPTQSGLVTSLPRGAHSLRHGGCIHQRKQVVRHPAPPQKTAQQRRSAWCCRNSAAPALSSSYRASPSLSTLIHVSLPTRSVLGLCTPLRIASRRWDGSRNAATLCFLVCLRFFVRLWTEAGFCKHKLRNQNPMVLIKASVWCVKREKKKQRERT